MHQTFVALTLLTLSAALLAWLLQRIKFSPILGYLALGVLAAPLQPYLFPEPEAVSVLADFGLILLMFFIGLEFHLDEVRAMLKLCLGAGTLQIALTTGLAGGAVALLGMPLASAGIVGLMIAFSSTALVMKAYEDRGESDSQSSRTALAILLLQDLAAIVAVALLPLASPHTPSGAPGGPVVRLALLLVVVPLLFFGSRYLLPRLFQRAATARAPESFSLLSLGACLSVALAAQWAGASPAFGAFLGGLVLCQTPFASQILADLTSLRNVVLAFFFVTVGMLVSPRFLAEHAVVLLGALAGMLAIKVLTTAAALKALQVTTGMAAGVALALAQIGEFSFVLGQQASSLGLISAEAYTFVLALAVLSMLLTPFLVNASPIFARWFGEMLPTPAPVPVVPASVPAGRDAGPTEHAIVVGYGPVGRTLARILRDFGIHPTIIDMNIETVRKLTGSGETALFGDAGRREILQAARVADAKYLLVTLPDLTSRIPVVATARILNPGLKIFVRARYLGERAMLEDAGASAVAYEEAEVAVSLAGFLLREIGAQPADIEREEQRIRAEIELRAGLTVVLPKPPRP